MIEKKSFPADKPALTALLSMLPSNPVSTVAAGYRKAGWPRTGRSSRRIIRICVKLIRKILNAAPNSTCATPMRLCFSRTALYPAVPSLLLAMREPRLVRTLVLEEPPAITLFVSSTPKPWELLRLLVSRPRTAAAIQLLAVSSVTLAGPVPEQSLPQSMPAGVLLTVCCTVQSGHAHREYEYPRNPQ
jgi:hypothetical protein